jgi:hypothetical protein
MDAQRKVKYKPHIKDIGTSNEQHTPVYSK